MGEDLDDAALRAFALAALPDLEALTDAVSAAILDRQPELAGPDGALRELVRSTSRANVQAIVTTLAGGMPADGLDVPEGALELLDRLAAQEDALPVMLRAYRLGAAALLLLWLDRIAASGADAATHHRLARASADHLARYVDRISELIVRRWSAIAAEAAVSGRRREALLRALLAGEPADPALLDHPLDRAQVVVAVRAPTGGPAAAVGRVAAALADPPRMGLDLVDGAHVSWFAVGTDARRAAATALAAVPAGTWCVVATVRPGVGELVGGARDALVALRALERIHPGGAAVAYPDVAVLAALLADEDAARRLVATVLGEELGAATPRAVRLRETLRAYFDAGERKTGAAALLGVHEKTVSHRLAQAQEALGAPLAQRRTDLVTALLIDRALAAS
ncbi:helix-turn-helix domain-containing protein [Paraconexibacter algicola]|uniref:Uncharacterized protein n=1 Tax=Paraconexibacter algicola TaxID=2133960 RepID=A0A2T4UHJ7_9ACTN|nr:helix-turn-helix domain-containing protein [Paraconexibacter algicola]PTL58724.1 hypothetical protein C7Y72_03200 [Paraconexibacter algicola]